jgi:hypothetical protein
MGAQTILIIEAVIALLGLISEHKDAKAIKEEDMDKALEPVRAKFRAKDPSKLPDKPGT